MSEPSSRLYRLQEIIGDRKQGIAPIIPVSRSSWYTGIQEGRYPKPVKLSERSVAWRSEDIEALICRLSQGGWKTVA